jgi:hypothetical protein
VAAFSTSSVRCVQATPERVKTNTPPDWVRPPGMATALSRSPISAVSPHTATAEPKPLVATGSVGASSCCCVQLEPLPVKT